MWNSVSAFQHTFYLICKILFNLAWVLTSEHPRLPFLACSFRKPLAACQSVRAAGERLELDCPFPSYLRLGTLSQGSVGQSERPTVPLCGMKPGLDSSSLLCLVGSLVEMGIKQGRFIGGGAHGRSLRSLMLCVMWWRGSCAPACIIPLHVTTAFSPGN